MAENGWAALVVYPAEGLFSQYWSNCPHPAPYSLTSGQGAKVGQLFGVATNDAALAADVALDLTGVFELTKIGSQAWTVGALIYWDDANRRCTTVATANLLIGVAAAAVAGSPSNTIGRIRLNSSFRATDP